MKKFIVIGIFFVLSFSMFVVLGDILLNKVTLLKGRVHLSNALQTSLRLPEDDEYPAFFGTSNNHHSLDHYVLFHNLDGWVDHAKNADIMFTGNSRVLYGFHLEHLKKISKKKEIKYYNLGFQCAEGMGFSYEIIRKHGLQPKLIVINGDEFFPRFSSEFAKNVIRKTRFEGWKSVFEDTMYYHYMRLVHLRLPYWENFIHPGAILIYRSTATGWWTFGFPNPNYKQQVVYGQDHKHIDPVRHYAIENAIKYKKLLDERNIKLIITWVPKPALGNVTEIELIAKELNVPYIPVTDLTDIFSFDHSHLGEDSAKIFSERFYRNMEELEVFQNLFPDKET